MIPASWNSRPKRSAVLTEVPTTTVLREPAQVAGFGVLFVGWVVYQEVRYRLRRGCLTGGHPRHGCPAASRPTG